VAHLPLVSGELGLVDRQDYRMQSKIGSNTLIIQSFSNAKVQVGRWRQIDLEPGYDLYVGSAFGPRGVQVRISRHYHKTKRKHWPIDYLSDFVNPISVWYSYEFQRLEHRWAQVLLPIRWVSGSDG